MSFRFRKSEKLCNRPRISKLFTGSKMLQYGPLRMSWNFYDPLPGLDRPLPLSLIKVVFIVPKKRLALAKDRNLTRRRMREAWRLSKHLLVIGEQFKSSELDILLGFQGKTIPSFQEIHSALINILQRFNKENE